MRGLRGVAANATSSLAQTPRNNFATLWRINGFVAPFAFSADFFFSVFAAAPTDSIRSPPISQVPMPLMT